MRVAQTKVRRTCENSGPLLQQMICFDTEMQKTEITLLLHTCIKRYSPCLVTETIKSYCFRQVTRVASSNFSSLTLNAQKKEMSRCFVPSGTHQHRGEDAKMCHRATVLQVPVFLTFVQINQSSSFGIRGVLRFTSLK